MTETMTFPPVRNDQDLSAEERKQVRRAVSGSAMGNAIEWFDYGIYGYLAIYIAQLFFTTGEDSGSLPLFLTFGAFAISFLMRPLGGLVLGPLGDRFGRRRVLVFTIMLISISTAAIGLLPTTQDVGPIAAIMLVVLRMVQGFSAGGEYAGAAVFMAEHAPDNRRGFFGSFLEFGTMLGFAGAATVCTVLTLAVGEQGMLEGWWRLPFLLSLPLGFVALWLRRKVGEPATFTEQQQVIDGNTKRQSLAQVFRLYPKQVMKVFGFVVLYNVAYYLVMIYMPTYLTTTAGQDIVAANMTLVVIMLVMAVLVVPLGALSDRIGRKPLIVGAAIGFLLLSVPMMMLIEGGGLPGQITGIAVLGLFLTALSACISSTLPAMFPTGVRFTGFAVSYNLSTAIFGGTASSATIALMDITGNNLVPGWYLVGAAVIGLIAILTFPETAGRSLRGERLPGWDDELRIARGETLIGMRKPRK